MARGLPKDNFDIKVLYGAGSILPKKLEAEGISSEHIPELGRDIKIWSDIISFFKLIRIFRKEKPQIVHLNSSKIGGLGALAARIARVPQIVFTVHGYAFNEDRPAYQKALITFLSWLTLIFATDVICISLVEYRQSKRWPLVKEKIHLVYNGISEPQFEDRPIAQEELTKAIGKEVLFLNGKIVVGTIAELSKNKGLEYALPAFTNLENTIWIIVGEGEERKNLEKKIKELELEDTVFLAGFISDASLLMKGFDLFLLPSQKEGVPYVLIEAAYAGLPVISTTVGGIPEIIEHGQAGILVEPKNADKITIALQKLVGNKNLQNTYKTVIESSVRSKFTIENTLKETQKIYL
jgi:glycosyltransferase involved in cell wall biosynthesis